MATKQTHDARLISYVPKSDTVVLILETEQGRLVRVEISRQGLAMINASKSND